VTDASGRATTFGYDATLRCIGFSLPDGRQAKYAYDGQGNLVQAIDLLGTVTRYEYDADGSLARMIVDRDQKTTAFTYQTGPQGKLLTAVTDPAGHVTRYELISMTPRQVQITVQKVTQHKSQYAPSATPTRGRSDRSQSHLRYDRGCGSDPG
jgi:YD repeat-containing protein